MSGRLRQEARPASDLVVWHDVECGRYRADLSLWRELADCYGGPILDVGAGTGRVTLALAGAGLEVVALDRERELLTVLAQRARGLAVETVLADLRSFELGRTFPLILVPMQTIQLLDGSEDRARFLAVARRHLRSGGALALAITETLEVYETGAGMPEALPDMLEREGVLYSSQPTAIRRDRHGYVLERRRERVTAEGHRSVEEDRVRLACLEADRLEEEARREGLRPAARRSIAPTSDHVGSTVVVLHG